MMSDTYSNRVKDLTGLKVGRLEVIGFDHIKESPKTGRRESMWKCRCSCGNEIVVAGSNLTYMYKKGQNTSCGCAKRERAAGLKKTHGLRHTRLNRIYRGMADRCTNTKGRDYQKYGARGIYIVPEWYTPGVEGNPGFVNFYNWAIENGYHDPLPGEDRSTHLTIDRKDNDGPYAPWNCQWVPYENQATNRRSTKMIYDGEEWRVHAHFEDHYGLPRATVHARLAAGWTPSAIVYAAKHPELKLRMLKKHECELRGVPEKLSYVDCDGFIRMIPYIPQDEE